MIEIISRYDESKVLYRAELAQDVRTALPTAGDGKFRVHRCTVVGEKDVSEMVPDREEKP